MVSVHSLNIKARSMAMILLCCLISNCANFHKSTPHNNGLNDNSSGSAADLLNSHWRVNGKLAMRTLSPSAANPAAQALRFDWQQQAEDYTVTLAGPLGFGRITVTQQNQRIYLLRGNLSRGKLSQGTLSRGTLAQDKNAIEASDIDQLFSQQTGWALPIYYLRYWSLGLPAPDQAFTANKTSQSILGGFKQDGWQISYPSITLAAPYPLPSKMIASNKDFKLVVAFKHWQFPLTQPATSSEDAQ